jgi:hypothetical protein
MCRPRQVLFLHRFLVLMAEVAAHGRGYADYIDAVERANCYLRTSRCDGVIKCWSRGHDLMYR